MSLRKAARLRHWSDNVEARAFDGIADHVGAIAKPSLQLSQAIPARAVLIGGACRAGGFTTRGPTPALSLCRLLVDAGYDPTQPLHVYRPTDAEPAFIVRSIGEGAQLTVETDQHGRPRLRRWRKRPKRYGAGSLRSEFGAEQNTTRKALKLAGDAAP